MIGLFFFFKQKPAYERRIRDWSSDVCSSDLAATEAIAPSTPAAAPSSKPTRAEAVPKQRGRGGQGARSDPGESPARRSSHPGKKPVLIHIPEDMHRTLRQLSVEEGGEPLTVITERQIGRAHV